MDLKIFEQGNKVIVETEEMMGETEFSTIVEGTDEDVLKIHSPICRGALLRIRENSRVGVTVFVNDKVYRARGVAGGNYKIGNFNFADIQITSDIERIERRNYFRLSIKKDVRIMKKDTEEVVEARTLDISAGGTQLTSREDFYIGENILVEIDLNGDYLELDGEVVNVIRDISEPEHRYGIKFEELGEKVEDRIMRYIFEVQLEERRKDKRLRD